MFSFQDYLLITCHFIPLCVFWESWVVSLTHDFSCLSSCRAFSARHTDTILSSYTFKSHYLLTESNRAELMKLPMIPSSSSATKRILGKVKCFLVYLFASVCFHSCLTATFCLFVIFGAFLLLVILHSHAASNAHSGLEITRSLNAHSLNLSSLV